ncbi:outer membrane protein assembly factor BamB [Rhodoferax lacus]|uniref:Outer membrane protein assembly factor BamB n=1 Tax=Rhodoferax lacus TaxID=2184758 RepID=A0A3E1RIR6_9BURK|nr:outer membrane protein assembly factor BamB [Rhodoferax lacus]RFO98490.1 outer membrane protein assembly factor BamB [Rhodoferax lacus]
MRSLFAMLLVSLLAACAGVDRPKPAPLPENVPLLGVRAVWSVAIGSVDFPLDVRVVDGRAYLASTDGTVAVLDAQTGADVWRTKLDTPLSAGVGSDGRYAAVVSRTSELLVLDAGKLVWKQKLKALTLTAPLVAGGRVFTLSADRTVVAFDAASGQRLWQQQKAGDALVLGQSGLLTAVGDTLVVGYGGRVAGLNPLTGATRWETAVVSARGTNEVERLVDVVSGYSREGNQICVRAFQYAVACLDASTGKSLWSKPANGSTGVAGDASMVYGTEADGKLSAWNRKDGEKAWTLDRYRFRVLSAPLVAGRSLLFGDDAGNLHVLSKTDGAPLNRIKTDDSGLSVAPVLAGKTLLVVSRRGTVYAFRPE